MEAAGNEHEATSSSVVTRIKHLGSFLAYLPDYGVLVCKSCEFAVQPSAISSHLLRHQIYREKRQNLLDRVAKLQLLEPQKVSLPAKLIFAIPHLSVTAGFRCELPWCHHLCISHKRMTRHLRERHTLIDPADINGHSQNVYLQTFFKGNKVRYFEVQPMNTDAVPLPKRHSDQYRFVDVSEPERIHLREPSNETDQLMPSHKAPETQLQIDDLLYMHHYTTVTGLSLTRGTEPVSFWTHDLPLQAAAQPFLMHGILGVAAFHQAVLASDADLRRQHQSAGLRHQSAGLATFRGMVDQPTPGTSTALTTFARLLGVQNCAQALLEPDRSSQDFDAKEARISEVLECMQLLRGGLELLLRMQALLPADSSLLLSDEVLDGLQDLEFAPEVLRGPAPFIANELYTLLLAWDSPFLRRADFFRLNRLAEVRQFMRLCVTVSDTKCGEPIPDATLTAIYPDSVGSYDKIQRLKKALKSSRDYGSFRPREGQLPCCYPHIPAPIYKELLSLPQRLRARIKQPNPADMNAFDQAMAALLSCFSRCYASDGVWARWNGIESWPRMLSDHFIVMIKATQPLALTMLVYWLYLISLQEKYYWFLRGRSQRMTKIVLQNLAPDMQAFVEGCISALPPAGRET